MPNLIPFKTKLLKPCKRALLRLLKLPYKMPISIPSFKSRKFRKIKRKEKKRKLRSAQEDEMDRVMDLKSFNERGHQAPFPSPLTPSFIKYKKIYKGGGDDEDGDDVVEEACWSFENYLVEMIVEEGKVRDLNDVEELLYCWNSLKSPVFVELVSRFYEELCKDLFSGKRHYEVLDDTMYE